MFSLFFLFFDMQQEQTVRQKAGSCIRKVYFRDCRQSGAWYSAVIINLEGGGNWEMGRENSNFSRRRTSHHQKVNFQRTILHTKGVGCLKTYNSPGQIHKYMIRSGECKELVNARKIVPPSHLFLSFSRWAPWPPKRRRRRQR